MVKIEIELGIFYIRYYNILLYGDHKGTGPFLSPLVISFSLSLPARLSFYHFLSHLVSGNRIEERQWIIARHLSCYNPLSCFTPFCGKIKLHDFFVFVIFSLSPLSLLLFLPCLSLSLSLSPTPVSLPISLSPAPLSLSFSLPSLSLFLSFFLPLLSLFPSFSLPSMPSPSPAPTHVSLFIFLSPLSLLLHLCGCLSLSLSLSLPPLSLFRSFSLHHASLFCGSLSLSLLSLLSLFPVPIFLSLSNPGLSRTPASLYLSISLSVSLLLSFSLSRSFLSNPWLSLSVSPSLEGKRT